MVSVVLATNVRGVSSGQEFVIWIVILAVVGISYLIKGGKSK
jgi:hypothetical protein